METYTRKYIVNPSAEQSLIRALANEALIKARHERSHQTTLAIQRLSEFHPNLESPGLAADRGLTEVSSSASVTMPRTPGSVKELRGGSFTSRSIMSAFSASDTASQQPTQSKRFRATAEEDFDFQLLDKEIRVLAGIRRKRWLNLRFEFVRGSSTALWFSPYVLQSYHCSPIHLNDHWQIVCLQIFTRNSLASV